MGGSFQRRTFLRGTRDLALLSLVPAGVLGGLAEAVRASEGDGIFLTAAELATLSALCDRMIPGPPDDADPGALDAGVPEYIDLLLGAFETPNPRIFSGGPFGDRNGVGGPFGPPHDGSTNNLAAFLELDAIQELVWRTRIEGSRGRSEREWNGPVEGLQEKYRSGLGRVDRWARAFGTGFARLPKWLQDWFVLFPPTHSRAFLDIVFRHTIEGMYGPPEYGGNRDAVGWEYTGWPGDTQPRGFTAEEVSGSA